MHVHQNDSTSGARWKSSEKEQEKASSKALMMTLPKHQALRILFSACRNFY